MTDSPHVFNATQQNFEQDVLMASMQTPILIDFWAPWCGPCKQLTPVIEKLAHDLGGKIRLAKVNTDEEMALASMFQIRSIPTVMLLLQGQPVDGFMGMQPESAIRAMLERHLGPLEAINSEAEVEPNAEDEASADADWAQRAEELRDALAQTPDKSELKIELAEALMHLGDLTEAENLLEQLPADAATSDAAKRAQARLGFARAVADAPNKANLQHAVLADDSDLQARYLLGARALLDDEADVALEQFLEVMRRDRKFKDDLGRKSLIAALQLVRDEDLVARTRRRMSALVF